MGIQVEFNPDLALRNISEFRAGKRLQAECIPEPLEEGREYAFLKKDMRNYWLQGEVPLVETKGDQQLSRPKASVIILEATHFMNGSEPYTKGRYRVVNVFKDGMVHFEGFERV